MAGMSDESVVKFHLFRIVRDVLPAVFAAKYQICPTIAPAQYRFICHQWLTKARGKPNSPIALALQSGRLRYSAASFLLLAVGVGWKDF